jgi:hypothetical protein
MKSIATLKRKASPAVRAAWATLGIPFDVSPIDEKVEGVIDIEALIITTLLLMEHDRMSTDVPAWLGRFSTLINHQKLKTMFRAIPRQHLPVILENLKDSPFLGAPNSVRKVFDMGQSSKSVSEIIQMRARKLNAMENVAQVSIMIHNRLQYGTGFRADIIALAHIKGFGMRGSQLAKVLCTNDSTVSRILNDLRACRFLDQDNERIGIVEPYPGMFISSQSLWNLCEMMDALNFSSQELKRGALENLNMRQDGFGRKVLEELI